MIDILFGFLIFASIFAILTSYFSSNYSSTRAQQLQTDLESKAFLAVDQLIRFEGIPNDWESSASTINDVNIVGLASGDRIIDENKLSRLSVFSSTDYNKLKQKLNIGQYDFLLELTGANIVSIGLSPVSEATVVVVRRIVYYKGKEANIAFTLYELR